MANDRVNALFRAQICEDETQRICRERIHWMCSQVRGEKILDLGCSEGIASLLLGQEGHQVVGIDINPAVLEVARQEFAAFPDFVRQNVQFELVSAGRLPFDDATFDSVLMGEVLEHQTRPERLLAEARRVLRPDGVVVITTPFGVFPDEDHRHTFYLSDFIELVTSLFRTEHLHILGKYICYRGSLPGGSDAAVEEVTSSRHLLRLSEQAFERVEHTYLQQLEQVRRKLDAAKQKLERVQSASAAEHKERTALANRLSAAERWHDGSLRFMFQVRGLLARNGTLGDLSGLTARTDRILSTANQQTDAVHALEMLADVLRDLLESLESQLLAREQELVRMRETQRNELVRLRQESHTEIERAVKAAEERARAAAQAAAEQQRADAEQQLADAVRRATEAHQKELASVRRILSQKEDRLGRVERTAAYLRMHLNRQTELLQFFKAELALREGEVRYRLGDAFVRAAKHPRDFLLLPGRILRLLVEGIRRTRVRSRLPEWSPGNPPSRAAAPPAALAGQSSDATAAAPPASGTPSTAASAASSGPAHAPAGSAAALAATDAAATTASQPAPALRFRPVVAPDRPPRLAVKVAAIMDEFTQTCFKPECHLMLIKPDNWKQVLSAERPDLLLVESAWSGNGGAWSYQIAVPHKIESGPLLALVEWCRSQNIPTVFWNKEDPPNFEHFISAARLFDYVFTTDENCVPRYVEQLGHNRVYPLPFAAQEAVHNPVEAHRDLAGNVCFAGTYYALRHVERQGEMELLLKPALQRGLTIFDRMANSTSRNYRFPPEYQQAIRGGLPYAEMLDAYKRYRVFLNVNSVRDSPTMFSRRVFELLACGTPVISTYALGIERLLGPECVAMVQQPEEVQRWLDLLLNNQEIADRMVLRAQRRIFYEHTYQQRLRTILETIGVPVPTQARRVSVVTCTNRPANLERVIANYERQKYPDKELVLVLNSDAFVLDDVKKRLETVADARVFQMPEERTLGACLNKAIEEMRGAYWTKFDDDNFYAEHFVTDMMMPFLYSEALVVGKFSYYAYLAGPRCLALRFPGHEHEYAPWLSGSAMIVDRRVFEQIRFPDQNRGEDTQFVRDCVSRGIKLYSADRFNYVVRRSKRVEDHTWQIPEADFLRACQVVAYTDDYEGHVVA